ncbi:MAG: DEAD/DEAH box helicase [Schleiferiaceae bacterium]|nr:DEAD/DEAH box helicase [Schleiferiaceae bacterium]
MIDSVLFSLSPHPILLWTLEAFWGPDESRIASQKIYSHTFEEKYEGEQGAALQKALLLAEATTEKAFADRLTVSFSEFERKINHPTLHIANKLQIEKHCNRVDAALCYLKEQKFLVGIGVKREDSFSKRELKHPKTIAFQATIIRNENEYVYRLSALLNEKPLALLNAPFSIILEKKGWFALHGFLCHTPNLSSKFLSPFIDKNELTYTLSGGLAFVKSFVYKQINNVFIQWQFEGVPTQTHRDYTKSRLIIQHDAVRNQWLVYPEFLYSSHWVKKSNHQHRLLEIKTSGKAFSIIIFERNFRDETLLFSKLCQQVPVVTIYGDVLEVEEGAVSFESLLDLLEPLQVPLFWKLTQIYPLKRPQQNLVQRSKLLGSVWYVKGALQAERDVVDLVGVFQTARSNQKVVLINDSAILIPTNWQKAFCSFEKFVKVEGNQLAIKDEHLHLFPIDVPNPTAGEQGYSASNHATLRTYQHEGVVWLVKNYTKLSGVLLADDMGLGKTIQVLTLLQTLKDKGILAPDNRSKNVSTNQQLSLFDIEQPQEETTSKGPAIVVVPVSLLHTWEQEARKFFPELRIYRYYGGERHLFSSALAYNEILLTSYSTFRNDWELFQSLSISVLVLDEAQAIKNHNSKTHQAIKMLKPAFTIAMSGTPVENAATDLWSIFHVLAPSLLGGLSQFESNFPTLQKGATAKESDVFRLRKLLAPYLMRRTKEQVAKELPELSRQVVWVEMHEEQAALYEATRILYREELLAGVNASAGEFNALLFKTMMQLRQIANHPELVGETQPSGKFDQIMADIEQLVGNGKKVLVFSSFKKHVKLLHKHLTGVRIPTLSFTGSDTAAEREDAVQRFMKSGKESILLMTLKAGGVGLTLTAADYVFLVDPWWNPQAEEQAIARAHRIGTRQPVTAIKYLTVNSIEERIFEMQQRKTELAIDLIENNIPAVKDRMAWIEALTGM